MENTKTPTPSIEVEVKPKQNLPSSQLLAGLYFIWDAFERANVPFFLVGSTAESAIAQKDLTGDRVTVGVRKMEWISGGRRIIDSFVLPVEETEQMALYMYEGTPIELHVYDDNEYIMATDMVRYKYEEFKVPNPYAKFKELYG